MKTESLDKRLLEIENEIGTLKSLIIFRFDYFVKPKVVSFRGLAKPLVSMEELDKAISEAELSLFTDRF